MNDRDYFSNLYEIASQLNKEYLLPAALRISLKKTVELLELETGWIWLSEVDNGSVYLAASHNLPPALSEHPERLSGRCYCITQYLSGEMGEATNISEMTCSRLEGVSEGTAGLKSHASIPITINGQKVGLMNLLSKGSQQLNDKQLAILNTISQLIGMAVQRTRLQQSYGRGSIQSSLHNVLERVLDPQIEAIITGLDGSAGNNERVAEALKKAKHLQEQFLLLRKESEKKQEYISKGHEFNYPESPLTKREMEVLPLIQIGLTNRQIAEQLFISERTVKFHVTAILSKLNADTRTEAVDISLKRGLLRI